MCRQKTNGSLPFLLLPLARSRGRKGLTAPGFSRSQGLAASAFFTFSTETAQRSTVLEREREKDGANERKREGLEKRKRKEWPVALVDVFDRLRRLFRFRLSNRTLCKYFQTQTPVAPH